MKYLLLCFAISLLCLPTIAAQNDTEAAPTLSDIPTFDSLYPYRVIYEMFDIEKAPSYPGGEKELLKYMAENIKLPPMSADTYIASSTALTFIIETDGSISNKKLLRDNGPLAQAALKMLDQMPRWSPGMRNGQPVPVRFTLPIRVRLE